MARALRCFFCNNSLFPSPTVLARNVVRQQGRSNGGAISVLSSPKGGAISVLSTPKGGADKHFLILNFWKDRLVVIEKQMRGRCSGGGQKPSKVSSSKWRLPDSGSLVTGLLSPICEDYICGCGTETGLYGSGTQWQSLISSLIFYTGRSSRCQLALQ